LFLQVAGTVTLGLANIIGLAFLTALLGDYGARQVLLYNGLGWIASLLPAFGVSRAFVLFFISCGPSARGHQQGWIASGSGISM
jgi:hypothetical protein